MSNVFISHSSCDKSFVRKLAAALLSKGFPVWLDSWKLEFGDSIFDEIYKGIEESGVVLLVISKHAIESGWVNSELNAALTKERQLKRNFLIPIKIDDCNAPLKIADRLYIDFTSSFSLPLSKLEQKLSNDGVRSMAVSSDRELVTISFTKEVHLDTAALNTALEHLRKRHQTLELAPQQILINDDDDYLSLLNKLHERIDNIASDADFSPDLEHILKITPNEVLNDHQLLSKGLSHLINQKHDINAIYWFSRIIRGRCVYRLWASQSPRDTEIMSYGENWINAFLISNFDACSFFDTNEIHLVDIWTETDTSNVFKIWISADELKWADAGIFHASEPLIEVCSMTTLNKYVYPQILLHHLTQGTTLIPRDLKGVVIGLS